MNHWKMLIVTALVFPALVLAQQEQHEEGGLQQPPQTQEQPGATAPPEAEMSPTEPGFLTRLEPDQVLITDLMGTSIRSADAPPVEENRDAIGREGEDLGAVDDLILGEDGRVVGVVFGVGGFLGIGARDVALNWELIAVQRDPENPDAFVLVADVAPGAVREAPEFDRDPEYNGMFN